MKKIKNPLTAEERLIVPELIGHDSSEMLCLINNAIQGSKDISPEDTPAYILHIENLMSATLLMSRKDEIMLMNSSAQLHTSTMSKLFPRKNKRLEWKLNYGGDLITSYPILHMQLYNLAKNGFYAMNDVGTITISITKEKELENPSYMPPDAITSGPFLKFDVHDTGKGFPKDKSVDDLLEFGASTKNKGGFGLYFAKLASKFLSAPLKIESEPRNTHVAVYHPIYE